MKKSTKNKPMSKKSAKKKSIRAKSSPISTIGDQDVLSLLTTLVEKLTSFETKIDIVLDRVSQKSAPQPITLPRQPLAEIPMERRRNTRPMYRATCADCRTYCEVPFRPSGDRPVFCKECYRARKKTGNFRSRLDDKPREITPVYVQSSQKPKLVKRIKSVKKKPIIKKKKKSSRKK